MAYITQSLHDGYGKVHIINERHGCVGSYIQTISCTSLRKELESLRLIPRVW